MRARFFRVATFTLVAVLASAGAPGVKGPAGGGFAQAETPDALEPFTGPHSLVGSYLAGRVARGQNETGNAAAFYRSALDRDPGNDMLLEQAFQMEAMEGAGPRTIELARRLVEIDPQHRTALFFLGIDAFKSGAFKKSEEHFKGAGTGPFGELTSAMAQAWVQEAMGNTSKALESLQAPRQAEWAQFYLRYHRALVADLAGRRHEARSAYERVFRQDPKALRTTLAYAQHAAHSGDFKLARAILAEHIDKNQGEAHPLVRSLIAGLAASTRPPLLVATPAEGLAETFYGLGEALIAEGAVPAGTIYMQMALSIEPGQQFALAALANAYESAKRFDDAIAVYDRIPKGSALELPIDIRKAFNLNSLERADEARQNLSSLIERMSARIAAEPAHAPALEAEAGEAAPEAVVAAEADRPLKLGSKGEKVREVQEALVRLGYDPGGTDGRFGDETRRAVKAFQADKGLEADGLAGPETVAAILGAVPKGAEPKSAQAAAAQPAVVPLAPFSASDQLQVLDALGSIQRSRKLYADSTETYTRAIALIAKVDRRHWPYFYARGTSFERLKNWSAAEADLVKALELAPDQPLVLNYLGYSWIDQGLNLDKGMALIEKAVALKPDDGYIVDSLGWAHFKLGNYKEAVRYLERAVELKPDDPILNDHLGDALWRAGREREARFQWDQALSLNPEPEDLEKIRKKLSVGLEALPAGGQVVPEKKTTEVQSAEPPQQAQ